MICSSTMKRSKTAIEVQNHTDIVMNSVWKSLGVEPPVKEYKFLEKRKFRFDYAWKEKKLAIEIEGGVWVQGRHTRGAGYIKDMEKYNLATKDGWRLLRFTHQDFKKMETYQFIKECLES
jgi:very-short-patch-repair endonuclease